MNAATRGAGRLLAALALVATAAGCGGGDADADSRAGGAPGSTPAPSPIVALTPRPPGPPRYYPEQHFKGPNPYDLTFAMAVSPYHGLTYGSRFNVVLTVTNQERRPVVVSTFMSFGRQIVVKVVNTGGGDVERLDNHDPATNSKYPFFVRGVNYPDRKLKPGVTRMRAVVEIIDVLCPGGGDFITEVAGGIAHVIKRGSNGGRHLAWVENDAADYAKMRAAHGASNTAPPHSVCRPQSVE